MAAQHDHHADMYSNTSVQLELIAYLPHDNTVTNSPTL